MGRIYLVRHGRTAWNKAQIFRGPGTDVPLDKQGRLEAAAVAGALREVPLRGVYASPLPRARETAETIAAGRDGEVIPDDAFTDIDYGEWSGLHYSEVQRRFPELYRLWKVSPHLVKFPGGESLDDVRCRAAPRLMELARRHVRETVAVVSHRVVLKLLLCEAKGLDNSHFWRVRFDTGAISVVERRRGSLRLLVENDTCHLRGSTGHSSRDF